MTGPDYVCFVSYGNDSIALLQWCLEKGLRNVVAAYSNTGWSAPWWDARVKEAQKWVTKQGYLSAEIPSIGMKDLVRQRKGWPRNRMQFCTTELKIRPAQEWLDEIDPDKESTCLVGVRREESRARREWPEWLENSGNHGGRSLWSPLAAFREEERDALILRSGFSPLEHRSMECFPCINSNKADLRQLTPGRINEIEEFENSLGVTSKGKPRTMFRPGKHRGAVGIREIHKWAQSGHGKYEPPSGGCDSGFCGT